MDAQPGAEAARTHRDRRVLAVRGVPGGRDRRRAEGPARRGLEAMVAGAALLPLVVWLIHGSIDWFWEIPALTGPALGCLAMACALGARDRAAAAAVSEPEVRATSRPAVRAATVAAGVLALSRRSSCSDSPTSRCARSRRQRSTPERPGKSAE